jgi:hypothetical protein
MKTQFFKTDLLLKDGMTLIRDGKRFKVTRVRDSKIFSTNNSKINICGEDYNERMVSFDLRAGVTCPAALLCLAHVQRTTDESGKVTSKVIDGENAEFRCYAASQEAVYKNTYDLRERNKELSLRDDFVSIITAEIKRLNITAIRIHSSGDFYNGEYLKKWIQIAKMNPNVRFFGYTKMASFIKFLNAIPNMFFVYSNGGVYDGKSILNGIPTNTVVKSHLEAQEKNLPVTCEKNHKASDYEMIVTGNSFSIVLHGTQKAKETKKVKELSDREKTIKYNMSQYDLTRKDAIALAVKHKIIAK